ncbi:hypothetical protein KVL24_04835 [Helicobacter pylori]|nr:hypothetical protein KVL24_04835 [Helicobacter pylori]
MNIIQEKDYHASYPIRSDQKLPFNGCINELRTASALNTNSLPLFKKISMRLWGNLLGVIFYDLFAGMGIVGCA